MLSLPNQKQAVFAVAFAMIVYFLAQGIVKWDYFEQASQGASPQWVSDSIKAIGFMVKSLIFFIVVVITYFGYDWLFKRLGR